MKSKEMSIILQPIFRCNSMERIEIPAFLQLIFESFVQLWRIQCHGFWY